MKRSNQYGRYRRPLTTILCLILLLFSAGIPAFGQVPPAISAEILEAEDARNFSPRLAVLLSDKNAAVRRRAALAAGRIGDDAALGRLVEMLESDSVAEVREMAAFAIGEIESAKAAGSLLTALRAETSLKGVISPVTGRLIEAAGKIAAANPKDASSAELATAVAEFGRKRLADLMEDQNAAILMLTALLRSRPTEAENVAGSFLASRDARVRADAANVLARLRSKKYTADLIKILSQDVDAVVRANAARALGAGGDRAAEMSLLEAATGDSDVRVRVSAIRSLGAINSSAAGEALLSRTETLIAAMQKSSERLPAERNELLEIFPVLGKLFYNSRNERAAGLLEEFARMDKFEAPEPLIARIRIIRHRGTGFPEPQNWRQIVAMAAVIAEFANIDPIDEADARAKAEAPLQLRKLAVTGINEDPKAIGEIIKAIPEILRLYARFKTSDLPEVLRKALENKDVFVRATAAELIAELPATEENTEALKRAFAYSLSTDRDYDDAALAILDALKKINPAGSLPIFGDALQAPDYLVRKKAAEILADPEIQKLKPEAAEMLAKAKKGGALRLRPWRPAAGTKLGQILNAPADYRRAAGRKNGTVEAIVETEKGTFAIELLPEDAPLTVDNFITLARRGYFNGLAVHRLVPNFVVQDGDPRGDGNGGPGWSIRCEINMLAYGRGMVGMALSGKDTGGSQWFVTHSPQPHLDGGYTIFGRIDAAGMAVVDRIVRGDRILKITIRGDGAALRRAR